MIVRRFCGVVALSLLLALPAGAQSGSSPVVLDLVVRDKKNVPVADLRAEEVELYEDGVKQAIRGLPARGDSTGRRRRSGRDGRGARVGPARRAPVPEARRARSAISRGAPPRSSSRSSSPPGCPWPCCWSDPSSCRSRASPPTRPSSRTRSSGPSTRPPGPGTRTFGPCTPSSSGSRASPAARRCCSSPPALGVPPGFEDSAAGRRGPRQPAAHQLLRRRPARVGDRREGRHADRRAGGGQRGCCQGTTELYG